MVENHAGKVYVNLQMGQFFEEFIYSAIYTVFHPPRNCQNGGE